MNFEFVILMVAFFGGLFSLRNFIWGIIVAIQKKKQGEKNVNWSNAFINIAFNGFIAVIAFVYLIRHFFFRS